MQLEQQQTFEIKGPQLEIFGEIESKLPAPAKKRPTAALFLAALALVSVVGIGGAKLKGQYNAVQAVYTQIDAYNHGIQPALAGQADAAASLLRVAQGVLGQDDANCAALAAALDTWNATPQTPAAQCKASLTLNTTLNTVYTAARAVADSAKTSQMDGLYDEFTSNRFNVDVYVSEDYTPAAERYNRTASGFPAGLIGTLWGAGQAELYTAQ